MKMKFTPLVIVALAAMVFSIYYAVSGKGGNLAGLAVIALWMIAALSLVVHVCLKKLLRTKLWTLVATELVLIAVAAFIYFKQNGSMILNVPPHYKGYIIVVYGAENQPPLPAPGLLEKNLHVMVPSSGIILTSDKRGKLISVWDKSDKSNQVMKAGYGFPYAWDSLMCGNKKYRLEVLVLGSLPTGWLYKADSVERNKKKELACKALSGGLSHN